MRVNVVMPKMGESINEGTLIKWHKKKGDLVQKDEIIFEISTDKVDTEIPSPEAGKLVEIKVFEQETVEVDTVVAIIDTNGEAAVDEKQNEKKNNSERVTEESNEKASTTQIGGELIDIPMPKMGESVMEGTIIKWHKKVGDKVGRDEIIFDISTDKVDTEVPSPIEGTLAEILFKEGETVDVGVVVAKISTSGGIVKPKEEIKIKNAEENKQEALKEEPTAQVGHSEKINDSSSNRFYSPLVMNIASKENVSANELETINGTGVNGRVTKNDILKYIEDRKSGKAPAAAPQKMSSYRMPEPKEGQPAVKKGEGVEIIPMDNIRKRIMYHMTNSRDTSVHVTAVLEVDMTRIHNFINSKRDEYFEKSGVKLTYMPFISHAVIKGLKEYPLLNASIDGDNIVVKKYINIGIAVAVEPNGLIVPNIKNADEKNILGLSKAITEIGKKARGKGLIPDDIMDGTFTITNYGVFGSLFGTPIINQPEVGILGVGAVVKKPVVITVDETDTIAVKPMMYLSLSHDHRLVDGMLGGKFLKSIKDSLENFDTSIV